MFRLLLICFFVTSISAYAGQHGSGGNICVARGDKRYKAFDEIKFPERASGLHRQGSEVLTGQQLNVFPILFGMHEGDLLSSRSSDNARNKILNLAANDEVLAGILITYFDLMKDVFVASFDFEVYAEVGRYSSELCKPGSLRSVILTRPTGAILVSSTLWKRLSLASQEVILIHETLRIAQLFSGWFDVSNDELEELTMRLYSEDIHGFITHPFYENFKKAISQINHLSRHQLEHEVSVKNELFGETLIWKSGEEAFKLQLSILEKASINGQKFSDILKEEFKEMQKLKRNSYYLEHVASDLFNQFGTKGP